MIRMLSFLIIPIWTVTEEFLMLCLIEVENEIQYSNANI